MTGASLRNLATTSPLAEGTLVRILESALRAPTGDNCQPFQFVWDGASLAVHVHAARAAHALDHVKLCTVIALGCLLESIDLAASGEGLAARAEFVGRADNGPWARVTFCRSASPPDTLLPYVQARYTDRRPFRPGLWPSLDVVRSLLAVAAGRPGLSLRLLQRAPEELLSYATTSDTVMFVDRAIQLDVLRLIRWSTAEAVASRDGMPWQTLGASFLETRIFHLGRFAPLQRVLNAVGQIGQFKRNGRRLIESSPLLGCFSIRDPSDGALLDVGRAMMRVWLELTRAGFSLQPLTIPSMLAYEASLGLLPPTIPEAYVSLFQGGRAVLQRAFGHEAAEFPVWMFRAGRPVGPRPFVTLRRPLREVLRIV